MNIFTMLETTDLNRLQARNQAKSFREQGFPTSEEIIENSAKTVVSIVYVTRCPMTEKVLAIY